MQTRLIIEAMRDRLDDTLQGAAHALAGVDLPIETAACLAAAQRRIGEAIADAERALRYLDFDGPVQQLIGHGRALAGATAVIDGATGQVLA